MLFHRFLKPKSLKHYGRILLLPLIILPLTAEANMLVELKKGDFAGTVNNGPYPVYDGVLNMNGSIDYSGTRKYATWKIKYAHVDVCETQEQTQIEDDEGHSITCNDKYRDVDSGYTSGWLDDPQSTLNIGHEGSRIIGANGQMTGFHWAKNAVYNVQLYGVGAGFAKDVVDFAVRQIQYRGKPQMMSDTATLKETLKKANLINTVGYDKESGERAVTLYFFPAITADYSIKNCMVKIDAGDTSKTLGQNYFHAIPDNNASLLSFKLSDVAIGDVDTITVTPVCNFEKRPGSRVLGTLLSDELGSVTYKVNVKEKMKETVKIINNIVEVIKVINYPLDRPALDNLFGMTLTSGRLRIDGEVVRQIDEAAKKAGLDSAKDLTYLLGSSSSDTTQPTGWHNVSDLGGKIAFTAANHTFSVTGIDADKLIKGTNKAWIKVIGGTTGKRVESVPQLIPFRLIDNADIKFLPPDDLKQMIFCKKENDQPSVAHVLLKLDLRQGVNVSKIELNFSNLNKLEFFPSPIARIHAISPAASISGAKDLNVPLADSNVSSTLLNILPGNVTFTAGQYEVLLPLKMVPRQDKVTINGSLWGTLVNSRPTSVQKLGAQGIIYEFSAEACQ